MVRISQEEEKYIIHGAEDDIRNDGRSRIQYRQIDLETGIIPTALGSARVILGNTDVLACVKAGTFVPNWDKPDEGKLQIHVDISAVANPKFEGRKGEQFSEVITILLNKAYESVKLHSLCIVPHVRCWLLDIDISVLSCGGNLYDTISFAIKAALMTTQIPKIISSEEDVGEKQLQITDDPFDTWTPDVVNIPCLVTLSKVGDCLLVDASVNEEQCSSFTCILAIAESGKIMSTVKVGPGSIHPQTFNNLLTEAGNIGKAVHTSLTAAIRKESSIEDREVHGFLY